ncbi:MAG: hypothetical protein NT069_01820, partial [Planctomycetota bacterium]|nr:hypothetical protein [Planctomycetota bacterium]
MTADTQRIWRFTPSRTKPELLEEIFVQRHDLLQNVFEQVQESALTGNKHHVLLVGPRGIGKTHFLSLLHHRVVQQPAVLSRLRIAWLNEDETSTSFAQFLIRIYRALAARYPADFPLAWLEAQLDHSAEVIRENLLKRLAVDLRERTLLLLVENLHLLFDGLGDIGQKQWRAFLQEHPSTCIVATSQQLFPGVASRNRPFFGFFKPIHLKPLTAGEAADLLRQIARHKQDTELADYLGTPEGRSRVRALHHLAGGNHRIYVVLSELITRQSLDELVEPFELMADDLTPYYQERLRALSPQQRQIVEHLCSLDLCTTPKEIARNLLATEQTIGGQLQKLLKLGYVVRTQRGRESLYELAEPLMRLATEVKQSHRQPLRMLVQFLRIWYRPDDLTRMLTLAQSDSLREHLRQAVSESATSPDPRLQILAHAIEDADRRGVVGQERIELLEERAHATDRCEDWMTLMYALLQSMKYDLALTAIDKATVSATRDESADILVIWTARIAILVAQRRHDDAVNVINQIAEISVLAARGFVVSTWMGNPMCFSDAIFLDWFAAIQYKWPKWNEIRVLREIVGCDRCDFDSLLNAVREATFVESDVEARTLVVVSVFHATIVRRPEIRAVVSTILHDFWERHLLEDFGAILGLSFRTTDLETSIKNGDTEWADIWIREGSKYPELEAPLRIFRTGITYLRNKDERVLLEL